MSEPPVLYEEAEGVARITLNRPARRNALDAEGVAALADAWARLETGPARVAILTGAGGAFCAGLDLETLPDPAPAVPGIGALVTKPVIAAVSGPAIGLGLTLIMQADLCVADDTALFRYPEAHVGFTGGLIAGLAARIPAKLAMEMILLGTPVRAARAAQTGLINEAVPGEALLPRAEEMARTIASAAPLVVRALKAEITATLPASPAETAGRFRARMGPIARSEDRAEGLAAFRERRRPDFRGR